MAFPVPARLAALYRPRAVSRQLTVSMSLTNKGLLNPAGENNCFLNSTVQVSERIFLAISLPFPSLPLLHSFPFSFPSLLTLILSPFPLPLPQLFFLLLVVFLLCFFSPPLLLFLHFLHLISIYFFLLLSLCVLPLLSLCILPLLSLCILPLLSLCILPLLSLCVLPLLSLFPPSPLPPSFYFFSSSFISTVCTKVL